STSIGFFVIAYSKFFFGIYGNGFYNHNDLMTVVIIGAILDVITNLVFQLLVVDNKMWSQFLVIVLRYLTLIIITIIFRNDLGGMALGLGYLGSTSINLIYYLFYYLTKYKR
ncbi:hypothetical protein B5P41_32195, partial [Bacillus sp. SRB_28]